MSKLVVLLCLVNTLKLSAQTLPPSAKEVLHNHFTKWQIAKDTSVDWDDQGHKITQPFLKFFECNLNGDEYADYALAIRSLKDSVLTETFIALIAQGSSYTLFTFWSMVAPRTESEKCNITLEKAGAKITSFGFDDEDNLPEEKRDIREIFPTDCITIWCNSGCCPATYVFEGGRFRSFTSGD